MGEPMHTPADLTLRDYFAAHAPIDFETVWHAYRKPKTGALSEEERGAFFGDLARLRYEFADAMIEARLSADEDADAALRKAEGWT